MRSDQLYCEVKKFSWSHNQFDTNATLPADSTIVATLAGPISSSFHSFKLLSWLASGFLIANTIIQPLSGKFTDIFGRRNGLIFSNVSFGVGTLLCGLAQKEWVILLGRVVAGIGAGGLNSISTFVISDLVPIRQRGVYQGMYSICYGLGGGLGGLFGGFVNEHWGWRNAFHFQLPFIGLSTILIAFLLQEPSSSRTTHKSRLGRIDFLGTFTLFTALVLMLVALSLGGNLVPWTHPIVLALLPISFLIFGLFVYIEDQVAVEPILPVRLNRTALSAFLANWFLTMSAYGILYYIPIYFQVQGFSLTQSGIRLIPNSIGAALGSFCAGLMILWQGRYYLFNLAIQTILVIAYVLIVVLFKHSSVSTWPPFLILFMAGFGYGAMLTISFVALVNSVDQSQQAVITSVSYLARSTGSVIGVTITSAIFQNVLKLELQGRFGNTPDAERIIGTLRDNVNEMNNLPPFWMKGVSESFTNALWGVWLCVLGTGVLGAASSLLMKEFKLDQRQRKTKN